jgi:predicted acetyltransferase
MPLVPPTPNLRESFLSAMAEFTAEGRGTPEDHSMIGSDLRRWGDTWHSRAGFAAYVAAVQADADPATRRPQGFVASTTLWWADENGYAGRIAIRHSLTPWLLELGGHIGYDVRPTARRRGYATAMLRAARPVAAGLGIDPALITCDTTNVGSRVVIEANGGVLEDERQGKLRFWVPTRVPPPDRLRGAP